MTNDYERYNFWHEELDKIVEEDKKKAYNKDIDDAVERVSSGKFITNDDVMDEMKKW